MTFEQWYESEYEGDATMREATREAWHVATQAERERCLVAIERQMRVDFISTPIHTMGWNDACRSAMQAIRKGDAE